MSALSFALLAGLSGVALGAITNPLGPYSVSDVTVSGLSAGAYMAVQMHVAYSSIVNGSAIFAGVSFFFCLKCSLDNNIDSRAPFIALRAI